MRATALASMRFGGCEFCEAIFLTRPERLIRRIIRALTGAIRGNLFCKTLWVSLRFKTRYTGLRPHREV